MTVNTPCREGITSETLSAWGDDGLSEAEAARLRTHISSCPACQARLSEYRDVSALVSGQRIPVAPPVDVAAARTGTRGVSHVAPVAGRSRLPRVIWGGIGAAVAAALIIAAFSQILVRVGIFQPGGSPIATPLPQHGQLNWSKRALPAGLAPESASVVFAASPANNQDAWICSLASDGTLTIWATTDQARSWHMAGKLTQRLTTGPISHCGLTPDSLDPHVLGLSFALACDTCDELHTGTYVSGDGGATWRALPGEMALWSLATLHGKTYALASDTAIQTAPVSLLMSSDGLLSWRSVGPAGMGQVYGMWPNPRTGALLIGNSSQFWRSDSAVTSWTHLTLGDYNAFSLGAWLPATGQWRICEFNGNATPLPPIRCTNDLGKTWSSQPYLINVINCPSCSNGEPKAKVEGWYPNVMTPDGSLFAFFQSAGVVRPGQKIGPVWSLVRLAPGANGWVTVGQYPVIDGVSGGLASSSGELIYAGNPSTRGGQVWYSYPHGTLYVASLPA